MSSSRKRGAFALLVRVVVFAVLFCGFAEVWFRTVLPASETPFYYQQQPATMYRFDPRRSTTGQNTVGRLCLHGGVWRINNAGWNSAVDYVPAAQRRQPMVAIFGDSFIYGDSTDVDDHVDAYLPTMLPGTNAYAFGLNGSYLEQYVAQSRYAWARFQPDILVIFIGDYDVSASSLRETGTSLPFWWQIGPGGESFEELPPTAVYTASRKSVLAKKSALLNYLRCNAKLTLPGMRFAAVAQPTMEGGTSSDGAAMGAADAWQDLVPAADFMVGQLCAQNPETPIVFVAHGDRYLAAEGIARTPLFADGRAVEAACSGRAQCSFIDLRYAFSRDWAAHHVRFEAADGGHWNAYANRLVARTLADFITENGLLDGSK